MGASGTLEHVGLTWSTLFFTRGNDVWQPVAIRHRQSMNETWGVKKADGLPILSLAPGPREQERGTPRRLQPSEPGDPGWHGLCTTSSALTGTSARCYTTPYFSFHSHFITFSSTSSIPRFPTLPSPAEPCSFPTAANQSHPCCPHLLPPSCLSTPAFQLKRRHLGTGMVISLDAAL